MRVRHHTLLIIVRTHIDSGTRQLLKLIKELKTHICDIAQSVGIRLSPQSPILHPN